MLRNFFIINILLCIVAGFLVYQLYTVLNRRMAEPSAISAGGPVSGQSDVRLNIERRPQGSYEVIAEKNLFHPSRMSMKTEQAGTQATPPAEKPVLFGTIILGDSKSALLQDPSSKTTKMYSLNESFSGYVVSDIQEDKVVLTWDGQPFEVKLREGKKAVPPPQRLIQQTPVQSSRRRTTPVVRRRRPRRTRPNVPPAPPAGAAAQPAY